MGPLTFLVGPNGAGKSNFLDALNFVKDGLVHSLDFGIRQRGGFQQFREHPEQLIRRLDKNGDGKISKEEFMAYHQKMWDSMKKDSNGMVDAKSMMMHHDSMMKGKDTSGDSMNH